jgi:Skp family chaperone for outer membrane proteins
MSKGGVSMMRLHGIWLLRLCLAPLSLMLAPGLAAAQTVESMPMEQVKECICQEQQIKTLSDRLGTSSGAYSQRQKELQDTEQQLADLQRTAQPGDPDAVTKAEALVDRRNLLRDQLRDEFPGYNKMITDYNQRVERYNATCTKQPMLSFDIVTAKENLSCPNP